MDTCSTNQVKRRSSVGVTSALVDAWKSHYRESLNPPLRFVIGLTAAKQLCQEWQLADGNGLELLREPYSFRGVPIEINYHRGEEHHADMVALNGRRTSVWPHP